MIRPEVAVNDKTVCNDREILAMGNFELYIELGRTIIDQTELRSV